MVVMDKYTMFKFFEIWQPRYRDKTVLLAKRKVGEHNKIVFTKAPSMGTDPYYISGKVARRHKIENNGKIDCYVIPLDKLETLEINPKSVLDLR